MYRIYTPIYCEALHSVHSYVIKRHCNYNNQMHDIYSLQTITVSATCFGVTCAIIRENLRALYLKPPIVNAAVVCGHYSSYVVI
jgi:hypothetical protein